MMKLSIDTATRSHRLNPMAWRGAGGTIAGAAGCGQRAPCSSRQRLAAAAAAAGRPACHWLSTAAASGFREVIVVRHGETDWNAQLRVQVCRPPPAHMRATMQHSHAGVLSSCTVARAVTPLPQPGA